MAIYGKFIFQQYQHNWQKSSDLPWCTRKEVRAALAVLMFALVLIGVRVGIFSFSYICRIVFYAHVNYYFRSCVWLRHYRSFYTHPTVAVTAIFVFCSLRTKAKFEKLVRLWLHISHVKKCELTLLTHISCTLFCLVSYPRTNIYIYYLRWISTQNLQEPPN